jgi:N-acetylmuramoyl-L-alanine amidase
MTDIAKERQLLKQQGLDIIYRETWGAKQSYTSAREVQTPVQGFFLHISVTHDTGDEHADMRTIERIGQERFGIGFPYNAAIFDTGHLYEGQPLTRRGAHTVNDENQPGYTEPLNQWYRAIVLPQMVTDDVTEAQVHGCARWAAAQIRAGYARRAATWNGQRDVAPKDCPGSAGYARLPDIRQLTEHYVVNGLGEDEEEMPYGWSEEEYKTVHRNLLKQEVPEAVHDGVDNRFSASGSQTRTHIAGTKEGVDPAVVGLVEIALQRSAEWAELKGKVDHIIEMLHPEQ